MTIIILYTCVQFITLLTSVTLCVNFLFVCLVIIINKMELQQFLNQWCMLIKFVLIFFFYTNVNIFNKRKKQAHTEKFLLVHHTHSSSDGFERVVKGQSPPPSRTVLSSFSAFTKFRQIFGKIHIRTRLICLQVICVYNQY